MGAVNCCAQPALSVDAWKTGVHRRTLTEEELERANLPMYNFEPSLTFDYGEVDGELDLATQYYSQESSRGFGDTSVVILSQEGYVELQNDEDEEVPPPPPYEEDDGPLPTTPIDLLPAPQSCPRSGLNLRRQSPTFGSGQKHATCPRRAESVHEVAPEPRLDDYLCHCKSCTRALSVKRAFQLYGFALDHPESDSLMRVLRACANYDETVLDVDPLILLHAEKMLEELNFDEDQTFRLLIASHFKTA